MGRHELRPGQRDEPERTAPQAPSGRGPTSAETVLALQASAGNQAVQRFLTHPTWTTKSIRRPSLNHAEWTENDQPPKGEYRVQDDGEWYRFAKSGRWAKVQAERPAAVVEEPVATVEEPGALVVVPDAKAEEKEAEPEAVVAEEPTTIPDTLALILKHGYGVMDARVLAGMRTLDSTFREHGSTALRNFLKPSLPGKLSSLSSLNPDVSMIEQYRATIAERAPTSLVVASDQVSQDTVNELFGAFPGAVTLHRGEHEGQGADGTVGNVDYKTAKGPRTDIDDSKMHNKAIVGVGGGGKGDSLISGSANLTYSAMNTNTESAVSVRLPGIAQMYKEYLELIGAGKGEDAKFSSALKGFNETNPVGVRAALAPFVNVAEALNAELQGADVITMRMYLVGSVPSAFDPVDTLCAMSRAGATVSVIVDTSQAEVTPYIREALTKLQAARVTVSTETGKTETSIMHDKMVFAHYPEDKATGKAERYTVMIGSSGLTKHVANNWNYENLLIIDDETLFRSLESHHKLAAGNRTAGIPGQKARGQRNVEAKLKAAVPARDSEPVGKTAFKNTLGRDKRALEAAMTALGMVTLESRDRSLWIGYPR